MNIEYYINEAKKRKKCDAKGGSSLCYLFDDGILLHSINTRFIDKKRELINEQKNNNVNVVSIIDYLIEEYKVPKKSWILEERAKGKEIHPCYPLTFNITEDYDIEYIYNSYINEVTNYLERLKILSNATQNQFNKFVSDYKKLEESPLLVDSSRANNFFYDTDNGFTFIDLDLKHPKTKRNIELVPFYIIKNILNKYPFINIYEQNNMNNIKTISYIPQNIYDELIVVLSILKEKLSIAFKENDFTVDIINLSFEKHSIFINKVVLENKDIIIDILNKFEEVQLANSYSNGDYSY